MVLGTFGEDSARARESRYSDPFFPASQHDAAGSSQTAANADRAVRVYFRRFLACAVERRAFLAGANPARQLSLQPVAARAVCGGNDMS